MFEKKEQEVKGLLATYFFHGKRAVTPDWPRVATISKLENESELEVYRTKKSLVDEWHSCDLCDKRLRRTFQRSNGKRTQSSRDPAISWRVQVASSFVCRVQNAYTLAELIAYRARYRFCKVKLFCSIPLFRKLTCFACTACHTCNLLCIIFTCEWIVITL